MRLPFAATWMNAEIVIAHEVLISQTEKEKYMASLICGI